MDKNELMERIAKLFEEYENSGSDDDTNVLVGCHLGLHKIKVVGHRQRFVLDQQREYFEYDGEKFVSSKPICYLNEDF